MRLSESFNKNHTKNSQNNSDKKNDITSPKDIPPVPKPVNPPNNNSSLSNAYEIYSKAIIEIKELVSEIQRESLIEKGLTFIPDMVKLVKKEDQEIISLADKSTPDIYFYGHCVNVAVFSMLIGNGLKYDTEKLEKLGLCAALNDIGMTKLMNFALKAHKLNSKEKEEIKKQKIYAHEILKSLVLINQEVREYIAQIIDQIDAYKKDPIASILSKGSEAYEFSRIIFIADVYEAITHSRAYRDRFLPHPTLKTLQALTQSFHEGRNILPHEALRTMLFSALHDFDTDIIKIFIDKISLYPPGSYVRLNTNEIAKVVAVNPGMPARPAVKTILKTNGKALDTPTIINLAVNHMIFIEEAVDETKIKISDQSLSQEIITGRWWNH